MCKLVVGSYKISTVQTCVTNLLASCVVVTCKRETKLFCFQQGLPINQSQLTALTSKFSYFACVKQQTDNECYIGRVRYTPMTSSGTSTTAAFAL